MKDTLKPQEVTQRRRKRQMVGRGGDSEQPFFCFKMGTQVEVSSDDEGFRGAWYVATILDVPSKKRKRKRHTSHEQYLVEYETLLADDDASMPLTEFVDVSFMRPLPPTDDDDQRRSFELDEVVDAFYRDGWWTGVITRVVGDYGSTFVVSFQNPPDEIEFPRSELRVHRDWVDRKWVRPEKQRTMGSMYSMGTTVEVCFDKENLCDVWFLAIFHREIGNNAFLVEYQSSGTNDEAGLSKVTVDTLHIRPSPPYLEYKDFVLFEEVDAFCGFGWWRGVITRFLKDRRYTVLLKRTNEEKELNHQEIRPRMDWIDGKWVIVSQQISIPLSDNQLQLGKNCNNVNDSERAAQLGSLSAAKNNSFERTQGSAKSRENKSEQSTPCSAKSPSCADASIKKKLKQVSKQQKVGVQGNQKGICVELKRSIPKSRVRSSHASAAGKDRDAGALNNQTIAAERKRTPRAGVKTPRGSGTNKEGYARGSNAEEIVEREGVAEKPDMSVIIGLECKKPRGSETENLPQLPGNSSVKLMSSKKKHLNHPERQNVRGITKPRSQVRRRPPKLLVEKPIGLVEGEDKNRAETASYEMVVKDCATQEAVQSTEAGVCFQWMVAVKHDFPLYVPIKETLNLIKDGKKLLSGPQRHNNILSSSIMNLHLAKVDIQSNETIAQKSGRRLKKRASKRQIQKSMPSSESQTQDSQDACRGKTSEVFEADCTSKDIEVVVDEMPSHIVDDRSLLMWSGGLNSPSTENDSRISLGKTVEQCGVAIGSQDENAMQSPAIPSADNNVSEKNRNLPFIKRSPVWETLESMEIFQMIPQQPHFRPLEKSKLNSREGLAIGSMVTFASVVERTSKLQFSDPRSMIDCCLETLSDLEIHGFDVDPVRGRLNELLSKKDRQEQLVEESKGVEMKIMEHDLEKSKIDEEIQEMNREMKELQEKLALATSRTEMKGNELAALQSKIEVIREDFQNAQHDFERLVAAPW